MKQANWKLKQDFLDYLKKLKENQIVTEIRLDSSKNPKQIEIIMQDEEENSDTR